MPSKNVTDSFWAELPATGYRCWSHPPPCRRAMAQFALPAPPSGCRSRLRPAAPSVPPITVPRVISRRLICPATRLRQSADHRPVGAWFGVPSLWYNRPKSSAAALMGNRNSSIHWLPYSYFLFSGAIHKASAASDLPTRNRINGGQQRPGMVLICVRRRPLATGTTASPARICDQATGPGQDVVAPGRP